MGRFLGRIHAVGALRAASRTGRRSTSQTLGAGLRATSCSTTACCRRTCATPTIARPRTAAAGRHAASSEAATTARSASTATATGNVLWTDGGPHFVDLDDCMTGPAVQDLWMLLSGDRAR